MRVNISKLRPGSDLLRSNNLLNSAGSNLPSADINKQLILERFSVSSTTPRPFEDFEVEWLVSPVTANVNLANYQFRIKTSTDILAQDISRQGQATIAIHKRTLLTVQARKGLGTWKNLGDSIAMRIDDSNCEEKDIPGAWLDVSIANQLTAGLANISILRLRSGKQIEPIWQNRYVEYKVPLEIVLPNFFNGDLDITWKLFFSIDYDDNSDCHLNVSITSSENADFASWQDFLSLGHTATIAATVERLLPAILKPVIAKAERAVVDELCFFLGSTQYFDTHHMLSVDIVPQNSFNHLHFIFCDKEVSETPKTAIAFDMKSRPEQGLHSR